VSERFTFPARLRIKHTADFARAYREGSRARGSVLVVVARPNGLDHPRVGLSVGRAIWRGAVQRNRLKRILREAFRLEQRELPAGFDLVLIPAAPRIEPDLASARSELVRLAKQAARRAEERRGSERRSTARD
jgi:ribonuclease P protein component